jgi:L-ascorbate metabolism protein UlaG (beta-lactamase superfamily)
MDAVDAVLISHVHYDHFDRASLRLLAPSVTVVPRCAARLRHGRSAAHEVEVDEELKVGDVTVRATYAEHQSTRALLRSVPSLGYVVIGSRRIYFAGDTDLFPGMASLAGSLDAALLPASGRALPVGPAPPLVLRGVCSSARRVLRRRGGR